MLALAPPQPVFHPAQLAVFFAAVDPSARAAGGTPAGLPLLESVLEKLQVDPTSYSSPYHSPYCTLSLSLSLPPRWRSPRSERS